MKRPWSRCLPALPKISGLPFFYALRLNAAITVVPADKTYFRQAQGRSILEEVLASSRTIPAHCTI